ncbi:MAG TPA: lipase [Pseudonocardia sp.]|jgi:triacylglycerol esterase/lipase EstA (alpha/beta hydrolase family)
MRWRRWGVSVVSVLSAVALTVLAGGQADAEGNGPGLSAPDAALHHALDCHGDLSGGSSAPVLLVPGTTLRPDVNFDWNYEPALARRGIPYCAVTLPGHAMADIQVAAESVVAAIRSMHAEAGRRIDVVGFSQGGMVPRWALKYWPDTRGMVDDLVGIDPSNHGTLDAHAVCAPDCAPSIWQQRTGSRFLTALNDGPETWPGIDYTVVYSAFDEVVVPNLPPRGSSTLHTGNGRITNVSVQELCPGHVADHLSMGSIDPVGYATVLDALTHDGPARPARIDRGSCARPLMPGVDPLTLPANEARYNGQVASTLATYPHVSAEPPPARYAAEDRR